MKTFFDEINEIVASDKSYDEKVDAIVKIGLNWQEANRVVYNYDNDVKNGRIKMASEPVYTFGIELECGVNYRRVIESDSVNFYYAGYTHATSTRFKFVTDASVHVEGGSIECVSPILKTDKDGYATIMCCIIIKPKGVKTPCLDKISRMNPDGFGIVTSGGGYYRTLSRHDALKRAYAIPYDETAVIHARLATHGSIKVGNCHPFNMGDVYFAHNGVLGIPSVNDMTDSETCFRDIIYPAIKAMGVAGAADIINEQCGASRFAIMQGGTVYLFGRWYYMDGCYYSNLRFMPYTRIEPIKARYIAVK